MNISVFIFFISIMLVVLMLFYFYLKYSRQSLHTADQDNVPDDYQAQKEPIHRSYGYILIDAAEVEHFDIAFGVKGYEMLTQVFEITDDRILAPAENADVNSIELDFDIENDELELEHRFIPISLNLTDKKLLFPNSFNLELFEIKGEIYSCYISQKLCGNSDLEVASFEQLHLAYQDFMQRLLAMGWKNYFSLYAVRYMTSEYLRVLEDTAWCIAPQQILSLDQFTQCLTSEYQTLFFSLYLDHITMEIEMTKEGTMYTSLYDMNYAFNIAKPSSMTPLHNKTYAEFYDPNALQELRRRCLKERTENEREARKQGYQIDTHYIDSF
ncbi:hypothetical protein EC844_10227 [Acinetobacter calcoaceticus]|uniref:Uncharacterized protein n=1 Tax=Acinetobacter calcoaceticus TaxID=471 RepID=A0A4V2R1T2_ACICA|nr:hypothetical protein EC844_10227 [Acinetobacter calcoaceticus]